MALPGSHPRPPDSIHTAMGKKSNFEVWGPCDQTGKFHLHFTFYKQKKTKNTMYFALLHCVSKNDTHVAHYNFNAHQPILVVFARDVAETVCYQMVVCYPTSPN